MPDIVVGGFLERRGVSELFVDTSVAIGAGGWSGRKYGRVIRPDQRGVSGISPEPRGEDPDATCRICRIPNPSACEVTVGHPPPESIELNVRAVFAASILA